MRQYASCEHCGEALHRYPGGIWEHASDLKLDWDHLPEPDLEPLTEAEAEQEYADGFWEPAEHEITVCPSRTYL